MIEYEGVTKKERGGRERGMYKERSRFGAKDVEREERYGAGENGEKWMFLPIRCLS